MVQRFQVISQRLAGDRNALRQHHCRFPQRQGIPLDRVRLVDVLDLSGLVELRKIAYLHRIEWAQRVQLPLQSIEFRQAFSKIHARYSRELVQYPTIQYVGNAKFKPLIIAKCLRFLVTSVRRSSIAVAATSESKTCRP